MKAKKKFPVFGRCLTDWLRGVGMTKYRLAKLSGVPESSIVSIANGNRRPTDDILYKIAAIAVVGVSVEELMAWRALDEYPESSLRRAIEIFHQNQGVVG